jgi:hypothetical protein
LTKRSFVLLQACFAPLLCLYFNKVEILAKGKQAKLVFLGARQKEILANNK